MGVSFFPIIRSYSSINRSVLSILSQSSSKVGKRCVGAFLRVSSREKTSRGRRKGALVRGWIMFSSKVGDSKSSSSETTLEDGLSQCVDKCTLAFYAAVRPLDSFPQSR